jgi:CheY-like chemotaxis protein
MKTIAIIEDNPGDQELMESVLESIPPGDDFEFFNNAEDFVEALEHDIALPKLIILDLNLPNSSGFSVLKKLNKINKIHYVSVVVLSTSQTSSDIKKSYELGANAFIGKPLSYAEFKNATQNLVEFFLRHNLNLS